MQRLSGYWQQFLGIVNTSHGEGGGILRGKCWLSLLKRSPKSYTLLHTLLPLPSGRTLQSLPNTVQFRTGINTQVFDALRQCMQKMPEKHRYCCLLFDEMSIRENVRFNQKFNCIEGFEDLGTCNIATLQITLYFSWSMVCIGIESSQWLTTSVVEVLRLRCLCNS